MSRTVPARDTPLLPERAFCERLNYDLLFHWFLDLRIDPTAPQIQLTQTPPEGAYTVPRRPNFSTPLAGHGEAA